MDRAQSSGRGLLTVAAIAGFFLVMGHATRVDVGPSGAMAQPSTPQTKVEPPFNSGKQREMQLEELKSINARLSKIESLLSRGLEVKVTSMPMQAGAGEEKK